MIIQTINQSQFIDTFKAIRPDNFTYEGLVALYGYLDNLSEDINENITLDVIALCCDYTEYTNLADIQATYSKIKSIEDLENHTTVIQFNGGIIIQNF